MVVVGFVQVGCGVVAGLGDVFIAAIQYFVVEGVVVEGRVVEGRVVVGLEVITVTEVVVLVL